MRHPPSAFLAWLGGWLAGWLGALAAALVGPRGSRRRSGLTPRAASCGQLLLHGGSRLQPRAAMARRLCAESHRGWLLAGAMSATEVRRTNLSQAIEMRARRLHPMRNMLWAPSGGVKAALVLVSKPSGGLRSDPASSPSRWDVFRGKGRASLIILSLAHPSRDSRFYATTKTEEYRRSREQRFDDPMAQLKGDELLPM